MENDHDRDEHKPEVIRQEMAETRTSMSEKIEELEKHLLGTVQTATAAVNDTVSSVKGAVQDTVTTVKETVHTVKDQIGDTASTVKTSLGETVDSVKESIGETVDSVKGTFDLETQVVRHPWLVVGGAVAAGYITGKLVTRLSPPAVPAHTHYVPPAPTHMGGGGWETSRPHGAAPAHSHSAAPSSGGVSSTVSSAASAVANGASAAKDKATSLLSGFEPELDRLKGMAIGALFGVLKDMVMPSVPPTLRPQINEVVDNVTAKMGGRPMQGNLIDEFKSTFERPR